jgi:hypothetical protein
MLKSLLLGHSEQQFLDVFLVNKEAASLETLLGNCLDEAVHRILSQRFKNVACDPSPGVDFVFEDDEPYLGLLDCPDKPIYVLQLKSSSVWGNSSSWSKQMENFSAAVQAYGVRSYPVLGHYFGSGSRPISKLPRGQMLFGDALWDFLTGYSDLYSVIFSEFGKKCRDRLKLSA